MSEVKNWVAGLPGKAWDQAVYWCLWLGPLLGMLNILGSYLAGKAVGHGGGYDNPWVYLLVFCWIVGVVLTMFWADLLAKWHSLLPDDGFRRQVVPFAIASSVILMGFALPSTLDFWTALKAWYEPAFFASRLLFTALTWKSIRFLYCRWMLNGVPPGQLVCQSDPKVDWDCAALAGFTFISVTSFGYLGAGLTFFD